jgi:hypothetical protein
MNISQSEIASPDWRALRAARSRRETRLLHLNLTPRERDAFYWRAYGEDATPSFLLRRFAESYLNGASLPADCGADCPGRPSRIVQTAVISRDMYERLFARAKAEGVTVSSVLRRFVLAYAWEAEVGEGGAQAAWK